MEELPPAWSAWPLVILGVVLAWLNWRYLRLYPSGVMRYLRISGLITAAYIVLVYVLFGFGWIEVHFFSILGRIGQFVLISVLLAEMIAHRSNNH